MKFKVLGLESNQYVFNHDGDTSGNPNEAIQFELSDINKMLKKLGTRIILVGADYPVKPTTNREEIYFSALIQIAQVAPSSEAQRIAQEALTTPLASEKSEERSALELNNRKWHDIVAGQRKRLADLEQKNIRLSEEKVELQADSDEKEALIKGATSQIEELTRMSKSLREEMERREESFRELTESVDDKNACIRELIKFAAEEK